MHFSARLRSLFGMAMVATLLASCATSDLGTSADLLKVEESESDQVTSNPVDDLAIFADLNSDKPTAEASVTSSNDGQAFYSAIGGERLGRVAYALYSDRSAANALAQKNPEIDARAALTIGQKVYFDLSGLRPQPMYLTKDLLERYPDQLANALVVEERETTVVQAGETLQAVSQRLYGTTRYWTEIYLLNKERLGGFDKVSSGVEISVARRAPANINYAAAPMEAKSNDVPPPAETKNIEEQLTADVLGGTNAAPSIPEPVMPPPEMAKTVEKIAEPPATVANTATQDDGGSSILSGTNLRRIIYVGLILVIVTFAFYVTRPSKKQKFDMLDMTSAHADGGKRPKLSEERDRNVVG